MLVISDRDVIHPIPGEGVEPPFPRPERSVLPTRPTRIVHSVCANTLEDVQRELPCRSNSDTPSGRGTRRDQQLASSYGTRYKVLHTLLTLLLGAS